jgi:hypothetical protein
MDPGYGHLLLDFFRTLVSYYRGRTEQGFPRSHALLLGLGHRARV